MSFVPCYNDLIMENQDNELLQKILTRLQNLDPPVKRIPVAATDPAMNMLFLDLAEVCFVTSRTDSDRDETMFVTRTGERFYNNMSLKEIEERLQDHPHFMRTSKFHVVNLLRIRGFKYSNARDLWFEGLEEPVVNAVTATYLEEFEKRFR